MAYEQLAGFPVPSIEQRPVKEDRRARAEGLLTKIRDFTRSHHLAISLSISSASAAWLANEYRHNRHEVQHQAEAHEIARHGMNVEGFEQAQIPAELVRESIQDILGERATDGAVWRARYFDGHIAVPASYHGTARYEGAHATMATGERASEIVVTVDGRPRELRGESLREFMQLLVHEATHAAVDPENANAMDDETRQALTSVLREVASQRQTIYGYVNAYSGTGSERVRGMEFLAEFVSDVASLEVNPDIQSESGDWEERTIRQLARNHQRTPEDMAPERQLLHVINHVWQHNDNYLQGVQARFQQVFAQFQSQEVQATGRRFIEESVLPGIQDVRIRELIRQTFALNGDDLEQRMSLGDLSTMRRFLEAPDAQRADSLLQHFDKYRARSLHLIDDVGLRERVAEAIEQFCRDFSALHRGEGISDELKRTLRGFTGLLHFVDSLPHEQRTAANQAVREMLRLYLNNEMPMSPEERAVFSDLTYRKPTE